MRLLLTFCAFFALVAVVFAWEKEDHEIFDLVSSIQVSEGKDVNFYSWLEVSPSATTAEIAKAYRKKSMQLHPDKNPHDKKIHERFARLGVVSTILRNKESRERYDFFYRNGVPVWRGTGYYYSRFRPGLGTAIVFLIIATSGFQYAAQHVNSRRDLARIEDIVRQARQVAWGPRMVPVEGQRKVKVNLGGGPESEAPERWISMVVDANNVYFLHPDGDMELLDASTATQPAISSTWFIVLVRSSYQLAFGRSNDLKEAEGVSPPQADDDELSGTASEAPGSGTVTPREGQTTSTSTGKRKKATKRR
uniref:J domain-containing protein n=1 Tax=Mycena chlorophos TaxID=658473 RepID=A0ABQ0M993_MYCCL|nr:predicted protein [Mycena chlorophos]